MANSWDGVVNGILYMIIFSRNLDDRDADRVASYLVKHPLFGLSLGAQRAHLVAAVAAHPLTWRVPSPLDPRGEDEIRDFLRRVLERIDELNPPPQSAFSN